MLVCLFVLSLTIFFSAQLPLILLLLNRYPPFSLEIPLITTQFCLFSGTEV